MATQLTVPELGEDIEEAEVTGVLVAVGDTIALEQPVVEMETGKATLEIPATVAGVVKEILVQPGDKARVGQALLVVEGNGAQPPQSPPQSPPEPPASPAAESPVQAAPSVASETGATPAPAVPAPATAPIGDRTAEAAVPVAAAPSVRKLARELGVDVSGVTGTGPGGRISAEDVKAHVSARVRSGGGSGPGAAARLPDFSKWGDVDVEPMSNLRRATAEHMARCWALVPHVTQHDQADITRLEQLRKRWAPRVEKAGGKLTPTAILVKVVAAALRALPNLNVSADVANATIIRKHYVHIGVAVDTPKGLVAPVIRDADRKNIVQLAVELSALAERARAGKLGLDEMQGGSFTVTNLGSIGGGHFTPVVNWPQVAILGVARSAWQPRYTDGTFEPRLLLPLSLSYDHRVVDGADGARFLRWIVEAIEEPLLMSMEG